MAKYYKLIDIADAPMVFWLPRTGKNGGVVYESFKLLPGKKYDEYINDSVYMSALLDAHKKIDYTPERQRILDECGAKYKETKCVPCNGGKKRLDVWFVEVVE